MPQRKSVVEKMRTSISVEVDLLEEFQRKHQRFGDFSHFVNESLRRYLRENKLRAVKWDDNGE